jgi:hypothetical protein
VQDRGYELVEYDRNEETGIASLTYLRTINGITEREVVREPRPSLPCHDGFAQLDHEQTFRQRSREDAWYDSLFVAIANAF